MCVPRPGLTSGVILSHRCVVYALDCLSTSIPEWGLSMLMKNQVKAEMKKRTDAFLKSAHYAQIMSRG
jgi:hypothetical protein